MYLIDRKKIKCNLENELILDGFMMGAKGKVYSIKSYKVRNIVIYSSVLASPIVSSQVAKKYDKLIKYLTELLVSDDDTGDAMRETLNQIEKFRLMIKNKYRDFLEQKELEFMSKQLTKLKKIANQKLIEIHNSYMEQLNNKRSK